VLRALQEGVISRVGSGKSVPVDVRVIAATNKDLEMEIAYGRFREDLLHRLNVIPIHVPALRERRPDIAQLIAHFSAELKKEGVGSKDFDAAAVERLTAHDWPGNIRELKNAVERLIILAPGRTVTATDVERLVGKREGPGGVRSSPLSNADTAWLRAGTYEQFKQEAERAFLLRKLQENDWNVSETARTIKMPRSNLYKKMRGYGLGGLSSGAGSDVVEEEGGTE
jgi:two-component system nitrogen regulation response regulator NtrX